ncbi:MAG: 50S ribosomal protein L11 methyltransferase [Alphaproteobacteria bacterium]|nr:50S ribosomal protein L11 methyltransferase [Alphaproteobacteria bacterium]
MITPTTWRVSLSVEKSNLPIYEEALSNLAVAVSSFGEDDCEDWQLSAVFEDEPNLASLEAGLGLIAAGQNLTAPTLTLEEIKGQDWIANSFQSFKPVEAGRYFIYGSHFEGSIPGSKIGLKVNAATAFGSGEHETTNGCLQAISFLAQKNFTNTLDMGCGSGILAMAMAKTWQKPVTACDIDKESVRVAKDNAAINGLARLVSAYQGNGYNTKAVVKSAPYDLIVANILLRPLCSMAQSLSKHLGRGGYVILSGFLQEDTNRIISVHRRFGLRLVTTFPVGEWQTVVLKR